MTAQIKRLISQVNTKIDFNANIYRQLSSLELVQLITMLEPYYKVSFSPNDVDDYYFSSLSSIEKLIVRKISDGDGY